MMLLAIAYRNIWRNPVRSLVVIGSMILGIWGGTFIVGFFSGMTQQQLEDMLRQEVSHIQIHGAGFLDQFEPTDTLAERSALEAALVADERVEAHSVRLSGIGLIASARLTTGGMVVGIDRDASVHGHRQGDGADLGRAGPEIPGDAASDRQSDAGADG